MATFLRESEFKTNWGLRVHRTELIKLLFKVAITRGILYSCTLVLYAYLGGKAGL